MSLASALTCIIFSTYDNPCISSQSFFALKVIQGHKTQSLGTMHGPIAVTKTDNHGPSRSKLVSHSLKVHTVSLNLVYNQFK